MTSNVLIISAIVLFTILILVVVTKKNKLKEKLYREFADKNGFEFHIISPREKPTPQIIGERNGVMFEITEIVKGTNSESKIYTLARIYNSPFDFDFSICKKTVLNKVMNQIESEDVQIDHAELDRKLRLKTSNKMKFVHFMNLEMIERFSRIIDSIDGIFENENNQLRYVYSGELIAQSQWIDFDKMLNHLTQIVLEEKED